MSDEQCHGVWVAAATFVHCNGCAALAASQAECAALKADREGLRGDWIKVCDERDALAGSLERARAETVVEIGAALGALEDAKEWIACGLEMAAVLPRMPSVLAFIDGARAFLAASLGAAPPTPIATPGTPTEEET